jgi:thiamine biosynthesis lipoprotein
MLTRFDGASDLCRVNRAAGHRVRVPVELVRALRLARRLARTTDGAFDPTAGPLVDLWRGASRGARPSRRQVAAATRRVGWRGLEVTDHHVRLASTGMALDLGGFGKGWAVDRVVQGMRRFHGLWTLVNFGESSLAAVGAAAGRGWSVLLRDPRGGFVGAFRLRRGACSTSSTWGGQARGEETFGRVVDPRTGRPLTELRQVTVLTRSAAVAEAASTALLVLGRDRIERTARALSLEVCWLDSIGIVRTPGFRLETVPAGVHS